MTILIAGFQHETNTFSPTATTYADFLRGGMFPSMRTGQQVLDLDRLNIPIGGFITAARAAGHKLAPTLWAGATPAGPVDADAYERVAGGICDAAQRIAPDAVYLDLHGAMVCRHLDDGDGELLARLRAIVGPRVPIVASLDLHANVTSQMFNNADILVAYRTYPHCDMTETGVRAAHLLDRLLQGRAALHGGIYRLPFLIPINAMATSASPTRDVYETLSQIEEQTDIISLSFAPGFPASDFPECGGTIWGYALSREALDGALSALKSVVRQNEGAWTVSFLEPDEAVRQAMAIADKANRPVIIADTQDNPGAGGSSDSMGMLRALLKLGARDAAFGLIADADAAAQAHSAGVGAEIKIALGGRSGVVGDAPYEGVFRVEALANGRCTFEGPMFRGKCADVGPSACLSIGGVKVAVASEIDQMIDRSLYRMVGIEPEVMKVLVNKSSVHFRADFEPIAEAILVAKSPGLMLADPADLPWTRLAPDMRVAPLGPTFASLRKLDLAQRDGRDSSARQTGPSPGGSG